MTPLPNDITRCYGMHCPRKRQCQRFITIKFDPIEALSYVSTMIDDQGGCDTFIEDKTLQQD
ncbi:hypothetical protein [Methylomonas rapida]|uniref:Uncharacterized protein n=1 Tax=Methylomonas rapida TaxID=2963939 RepID=A0ABY7GG14_9GAMM|nr:hypothetical protein [Methylomonas rapida]WAR44205.1 hypothetical protein NM686_017780 [Methylomonas rapida]